MFHSSRHLIFSLLCLAVLVPGLRAADPTNNPVATFYSGPEGYPAWTDGVRWTRVVNMKTYAKGKTAYEKFVKARDEISETGGVLYYPAGTYDFTSLPPGRGLFLRARVVIRGEAPKELTYRVVAVNAAYDDKGASRATEVVRLGP